MDSLKEAERQFDARNKYRNPIYFRDSAADLSHEQLKNSKMRSNSSNVLQNPFSMLNNINYKNSSSIY